MVEETANNNPIVNATKELALHVDKVGEKIQQLLVHEKSDDLKKERAVSKDGEKEVKKDQYNRRLQGAEVQLTRDAAIISRNSDKTLSKLIKATPGEGKEKLAGEGKQEKTVAARQDQFAKRIDTLRATSALLASGQVGNTTNLLVMDEIRQGANVNEKVRQSIESMDRQYLFDIKSTEAEKQGIVNRLRSNTINAYNAIPSTASILLGAVSSSFNTELGRGAAGAFG